MMPVLIVCLLLILDAKVAHLRTIVASIGDARESISMYNELLNPHSYTLPPNDPCLSTIDDKFLNLQPCDGKDSNKILTHQNVHSNVCMAGKCVNWKLGKMTIRYVYFIDAINARYYINVFDGDRLHVTSRNFKDSENIDGHFLLTTNFDSIDSRIRFEWVERGEEQDHIIFTTELVLSDVIKMNSHNVTLPLYSYTVDPHNPNFMIVNFLIG